MTRKCVALFIPTFLHFYYFCILESIELVIWHDCKSDKNTCPSTGVNEADVFEDASVTAKIDLRVNMCFPGDLCADNLKAMIASENHFQGETSCWNITYYSLYASRERVLTIRLVVCTALLCSINPHDHQTRRVQFRSLWWVRFIK